VGDAYVTYFNRLAGPGEGVPITPHPWQIELAEKPHCSNRLIRIPTGFGKTFGVLGAWLWNRIGQQRTDWPARLVWCLPMRVLVEQIEAEVRSALLRLGGPASEVGVHVLMGGIEATDWHIQPEREAILIGTQDMLLSRALNRGYGAARARWPMDFGLLNQDCLWVMDEVQLMDVGLATSAQLQAFREQDAAGGKAMRPCKTWWMSATLQSAWLHASPDTREGLGGLPHTRIAPAQRFGPLWDEDKVHKPVRVERACSVGELAALAANAHIEGARGSSGPTLIVVNRVDRALALYKALQLEAAKSLCGTDLHLIHSRFRPNERAGWRLAFLDKAACAPGTDRIIVATQVVEAGVDISAAVLITDMAPWPSLVQRFGRSARWGGKAQVIVIDTAPSDDRNAAPYTKTEIDAAREALGHLADVAPRHLEEFEEANPKLLSQLYPYEPAYLLTRNELDELFDTAADLSGADIDISRFIRSGEDRDLQVFWRAMGENESPAATVRPSRDELCAVPSLRAREWLCSKGMRLIQGVRAWVWDWLDGEWELAEGQKLYPGQTVLIAANVGGYDLSLGWDPRDKSVVPVVEAVPAVVDLSEYADGAENDESLSIAGSWQTIAFHGEQVGRRAAELAATLAPAMTDLFDLAGRWHDVGKVHPAFQGCLKPHPYGAQIAKAPDDQWLRGSHLYSMPDGSRRLGFRHELASTLALLALLRRCRPDHPALLGPWRDLLTRLPDADLLPPAHAGDGGDLRCLPIESEVLALDADRFDLLLYLVCSHHGKVRMAWHASPADQSAQDDALRIRGICDGDVLPAVLMADSQGGRHVLPATELVLAPASAGLNAHTGRGWTERVLGLLQRHGPFSLAWLEALMRAADQRATRDIALVDSAIRADNEDHGLERSNSQVAGIAGGGEAPPPVGEHPSQRGTQLRIRGGTGQSGGAGSGTRPPAHATRYLETRLGTLRYLELAPHLASAAQRAASKRISSRVFSMSINSTNI